MVVRVIQSGRNLIFIPFKFKCLKLQSLQLLLLPSSSLKKKKKVSLRLVSIGKYLYVLAVKMESVNLQKL